MRIRKLRPSPGVLIGVIALVFAFTGAAVAANKVQTDDIAKQAVTGAGSRRTRSSPGRILDGSVKGKDLANDAPPQVPQMAYGRVNKSGNNAAPGTGAVDIVGVAPAGAGSVCYDLAFVPVSGSATVVRGAGGQPGATVELAIPPAAGCSEPYTDAATTTKTSTTNPDDRDLFVQFTG